MEEGEREMNKTRAGANGEGSRNKWRRLMPKALRNRGTEDDTAITTVDTLEDYKREVVDEKDKIVVVRFYAQWCKSCKAAFPLFQKMKADLPSVKYVMVPLTKDTAYIHSGLGVPSVPFGHIYHPDVGLVEERKISEYLRLCVSASSSTLTRIIENLQIEKFSANFEKAWRVM